MQKPQSFQNEREPEVRSQKNDLKGAFIAQRVGNTKTRKGEMCTPRNIEDTNKEKSRLAY